MRLHSTRPLSRAPLVRPTPCATAVRRRGTRRFAPCAAPPQQQQVALIGECYEDIVDQLAARVLDGAAQRGANKYLVGIAGAPGSGKTTLAALLCRRINNILGSPTSENNSTSSSTINSTTTSSSSSSSSGSPPAARPAAPLCQVVPMDGFHYYRVQLDAMPDPKEAHARRGAHWTFDAAAFVDCVRRIRAGGGQTLLPSFDHAVGDPVEDDIIVDEATRIVLVEGNYLFLDEQPWAQLRPLFDDTVFVSCPVDVAMNRVFDRQVAIGLAPEVSRGRIAGNDRPNAELVAATEKVARVVVPSEVPLSGSCSE